MNNEEYCEKHAYVSHEEKYQHLEHSELQAELETSISEALKYENDSRKYDKTNVLKLEEKTEDFLTNPDVAEAADSAKRMESPCSGVHNIKKDRSSEYKDPTNGIQKTTAFKSSMRLVRLQAATECEVKERKMSPNDMLSSSNDSTEPLCDDRVKSGSSNNPETEFQFLTPKIITHRPVSVISSNDGSDSFEDAPGEPIGNINAQNRNSDYERIVVSVSNPSGLESRTPRSEKNSTNLVTTPKSAVWVLNTSNSTSSTEVSSSPISAFSSSTNELLGSCLELPNSSGDDGLLQTIDETSLQRFIASDGRYVYGYKRSHSDAPVILYAPASDRESHNEKERKRRSRVAEACSTLRGLIPGLSEKTDKATVFEAAAKYLKFIRDKFGSEFHEAYCLKFFQDECCDKLIN